MIKKPELLSPVSDFTSLKAAVDSGADAVYFGIKGSNMRDAKSGGGFVFRDLRKIAKYKVKKYLKLLYVYYKSNFGYYGLTGVVHH